MYNLNNRKVVCVKNELKIIFGTFIKRVKNRNTRYRYRKKNRTIKSEKSLSFKSFYCANCYRNFKPDGSSFEILKIIIF